MQKKTTNKKPFHPLYLGDLDDKMKWLKNFERLLEIQRNVVWPGVMELEPKNYYPEFLKTALMKQPCERLIVSPRRFVSILPQIVYEYQTSPNLQKRSLLEIFVKSLVFKSIIFEG